MALERPDDPKDLRYFTKRKLDNDGRVMIWVFNPKCPECGKRALKIPYDEEKGRFKSRSGHFVCKNCGNEVPKKKVKDKTPTANVKYTCPHCGYEGEKQEPFERTKTKKKFKFKCEDCGKKIVVGKMK